MFGHVRSSVCLSVCPRLFRPRVTSNDFLVLRLSHVATVAYGFTKCPCDRGGSGVVTCSLAHLASGREFKAERILHGFLPPWPS